MIERMTTSMCVSSDYCRGWNDAVSAVTDGAPHWIRISEQRPQPNQVIILFGRKPHSDACFANMRKVDATGAFERSDDVIFTHWMPLPDAPEV